MFLAFLSNSSGLMVQQGKWPLGYEELTFQQHKSQRIVVKFKEDGLVFSNLDR